MKRKATAIWRGGMKDGSGTISTESGVLSDTQYSFATRFENGIGTNPEELIAAAHAGCFSMALSGELQKSGLTVESIKTIASVTIEKEGAGFTISSIHLNVAVNIPGADFKTINEAATIAKENCPVSKLVKAKITMDTKME
jgi:osmotically inducible protein OsmC